MGAIRRRILIIAGTVTAVLLLGAAGFVWIENWSWFDAFYMSVITITTVGYLEVHPLSQAGRAFTAGLLLVGVSALFLAIGLMTQTIIELELAGTHGQRKRTRRMIDSLRNHFIICGYGRVGRGASEELRRSGVPFVVVDGDPQRVERAIKDGCLAVNADATRDDSLRDVHIDRAKGLIAALATDADNLFLILSAKTMNPAMHVAARVSEETSEAKLRRAGADSVLAPYHITGTRLAQSILQPHVVQFLDFATTEGGMAVTIEQVRVHESSEVVDKSLKQMQLRRDVGVIVLGIRRANGKMVFNPGAEEVIYGGDYLIAMGQREHLAHLERLLEGKPR